jgi:cell division transport system permease protein
MRQTLERWLGEAASSRDLPVPALATVELEPGANPVTVARAVRAQVPQATVSAETAELAPMLRSLRALQWLALSLVLLMGAATAAAIILAARGALDTHRPTVDIMHGIGATDAQLTRLFQRKIAGDAVAGAVVGAVAAALLIFILGGAIAAAIGEFGGTAPLGLRDFIVLGLIPVGAVLLAVAVARWTLLRALRESL